MILDVAPTELLVLGAVALLVIPPKDLPRAMRFAGQWVGKARGLARQFRSGFDDMVREAEFAEMEQKWKAENERIMREFPQTMDMTALMAPKAPDTVDHDPAPVMVEQPVTAPAPEPMPAPPEAAAKPAPRKPRAKSAKAKPLDAVEPAAEPAVSKPRARRPKAVAPAETPGE